MKKLLCLVVTAAIALGMATGCEYFDHKTPRRNNFFRAADGKTFSMTYEDFFASFNSRVESESKVGEVEYQDYGTETSNVVYYYPTVEGKSVSSFWLYVSSKSKRDRIYSIDHDLWLGRSDETERQQWVERVRALILSIDQDMDEREREKLMKKLGVFKYADLEDGYAKGVDLYGIHYALHYDLRPQEDGGGRVEFSCHPSWD